MQRGIGSHTKPNNGIKDEWLTPPEILKALGPFDLDPCAPVRRPWDMAANHFTVNDNGLMQPWMGRVWLNPPYGDQTHLWLQRMVEHGHGIALIFARTETEMFFEYIWRRSSAVLFIEGRLHFYHVDGKRAKGNAGGPSVLVAYGGRDTARLCDSGIKGKFLVL